MTTEIVEYSKTEAALSDLSAKYKGVLYDCTTREGLVAATKGRAELRDLRIALEKTRKQIKEPALRRSQLIDTEARRITAELESLEDPIDAQIKKEEARKEFERTRAEREAKEKAEAEERARREAEEKRIAEERAKLAAERAALEAAQRAKDEEERQRRLKIEAEERAARMRIEEEERKARLAREEADRQARAVREAEEAKLKAERDRIEAERRTTEEAARKLREEQEAKAAAERRAKEEAERKEREAEEARQREIRRKANELSDAREMLSAFKRSFGHLEQFAGVVKAIDAVLAKKAA